MANPYAGVDEQASASLACDIELTSVLLIRSPEMCSNRVLAVSAPPESGRLCETKRLGFCPGSC